MLQFLFDTDHLTLYQHKHPSVMRQIATHPPGAVGITPVSIEETLRGRLAVLARPLSGTTHVQAYERLVDTVRMFALFFIVAFDQPSELRFQQLRASHRRIGTLDLKIGAVALVNRLVLVTRNRKDFGGIPSLIIEDWSV